MLALTGYAVFSGGDDGTDSAGKDSASPSASSSASPTYAPPDDWTEPDRWAALPRGERTDKYGSPVGYPQSTEGAVAMMAAANAVNVEGSRSTVDEQLRIYHSFLAEDEKSDDVAETVELQAIQTGKSLHRQMGVPAGADLPSGAYMRTVVVGFKVVKKTDTEVGVWVLARATQKNAETAEEQGSYSRTLVGAVWEDGDWKLSAGVMDRVRQAAADQAKPKMVAPGDAEFNAAGWTAIREAS
ncbi:hypothetical protein [Streptomyces prasinus]|uniref:hypothetical protein n=1 Tax=Streptomyces prasinus TaxID=67345 RepID=UPI001F0A7704|nr:hypothetical protein [Streptomyces prasinus]